MVGNSGHTPLVWLGVITRFVVKKNALFSLSTRSVTSQTRLEHARSGCYKLWSCQPVKLLPLFLHLQLRVWEIGQNVTFNLKGENEQEQQCKLFCQVWYKTILVWYVWYIPLAKSLGLICLICDDFCLISDNFPPNICKFYDFMI